MKRLTQAKVIREIDGVPTVCTDIGCDDFQRAKENRERIASGYASRYWDWLDHALQRTPIGKPLPPWVPQGDLPSVGRERRTSEPLEDEEYFAS